MKERIETENFFLQAPNTEKDVYLYDLLSFMNRNREHLLPYLDLATEKITGDVVVCMSFIQRIYSEFSYGIAFFYFVYDKSNNLIGGVEARRTGRRYDEKFEIALGLGKEYCGNGFCKQVMTVIENELISFGANRFVLRSCVDNIAGNKSAIKLGYSHEGVEREGSYLLGLEKFVDMNVYSKLKD